MKVINRRILLLLVLIFTQCQNKNPIKDETPPESTPELTAIEKQVTEVDNYFGLKVFTQLASATPTKNIFISPLSVSMALGILYNGTDGTTREAMHQTLKYGDLNDEQINQSYRNLIDILTKLDNQVAFQIANSIWIRDKFTVEPDFITLNRIFFDAEVNRLDFSKNEAAQIINSWIEAKTNGKIKDMVKPPIDPLTMMFLINAIYFKGTWTYKFDASQTSTRPFYLMDGNSVVCPMMVQTCTYYYYSNDQVEIVDLPYGRGNFRLTIFLPQPSVSLQTLNDSLTNDNWNDWLSRLQEHNLTIYFPKIKLSYFTSLTDVLSHLGMSIAFSPSANFQRINPRENLYISDVKHKSFLEINEEGTEAAAVTIIEVGITSVGDHQIIVDINRPFLFAIREKTTGTILFIGQITNPTLTE